VEELSRPSSEPGDNAPDYLSGVVDFVPKSRITTTGQWAAPESALEGFAQILADLVIRKVSRDKE
jgi:hypothetical protein